MGTFGGRRALRCAAALLALALTSALVAGCSDSIDQAHSVQTKLNRIEGVSRAEVTTPSASTGAAIEVVYEGEPGPRELGQLIEEIDKVADAEDYPSYRLDLVPAQNDADRLTVDDSFAGSPDSQTVLENWSTATTVLLGDVHYTFEPGRERIAVDSGPAILHDVGEASRIGYGFDGTEWAFTDGDSSFVVSGKVSPTDVTLFQDVQRTVSSEALPAPATAWTLQRRDSQVLLDLVVGLPDGLVPPEQLTVARYGDQVEALVGSALLAMRGESLPVTLRLINPTTGDPDVFGYWTSDERPVRGRDPLDRGWDRWLQQQAG